MRIQEQKEQAYRPQLPLDRVVQGLWIGTTLTTIERACIASYIRHGHEFHLYTYTSYNNLPEGTITKDANEIIPENEIFTYQIGPGKGSYAAFANLFRYKLLSTKGGWWTDMDFLCLKPLPLPKSTFIAAEWKTKPSQWSGALRTRLTRAEQTGLNLNIIKNTINKKIPSNNLIYCQPQSALIQRAYIVASKTNIATMHWGQTGPNLINKLLYKEHLISSTQIGSPRQFQPIGGYQIDLFFHPTPLKILSEAYTVHLYNELWRRQNVKKEGPFPKNSLIAKILSPYVPLNQ